MTDKNESSIQLVAHSGIQFLTCFLNLPSASRFRRAFVERSEKPDDANRRNVWLFPDWHVDDPTQQGVLDEKIGDERYTINAERALEPYLGKWVPMPYLRVRHGRLEGGVEAFDQGPTNWVRVRIVPDAGTSGTMPHTHRVIFAVDTELKTVTEDSGGPYSAPTSTDVANQRQFRLVPDMARLSWYIQGDRDAALSADRRMQDDPQLWVEMWLESIFLEFKRATDTRSGSSRREPHLLYVHEHAARWYALVDLLCEFANPPRLSFIDTVSKRINEIHPSKRMVDVDFVLDVGNSRTCGILVERFPNQASIKLNNCKPLRLRDLSHPELTYSEPFESRVELADVNFGSERLSRMSGRDRAFFWPSLVRVGREAARIRAEEDMGRTTGGLSSPKRYLWDIDPVQQEWKFPLGSYVEGIGPPVERRVRRFVNKNGDVLSKVREDGKIFRSFYGRKSIQDITTSGAQLTFSRSSFYTFMLAEVIWHAWVMINDPVIRAERGEETLPRRLRKIILTLPTATPVREQRIMRARAESAVALLQDMMGWSEQLPVGVTMPEIEIKWDEATCVQLVWLYGEIAHKFAGNVEKFLDLVGRKREFPGSGVHSSLRVASVDIGGGTTDLMIITYNRVGDHGLRPFQNFREGVRIAGDDVLKLIVERLIMPAIADQLKSCGASPARAQSLLKECFDEYRLTAEDQHRRWQFVIEALIPAALALQHLYENASPGLYDRVETKTLAELIRGDGEDAFGNLAKVAGYLDVRAHEIGATTFQVAQTPIQIDYQAMRGAVNDALSQVFDILSEALDHFDVDILILSGRPARLPAVAELFADRFSLPPNRIIPLHRYRAGTWFPFRATENGKIADPKTTVVVGALLCTYAQSQLDDFYYDTENIQMRSTARFIGPLDNDGKMLARNVWFELPVNAIGAAPVLEKEIDHYAIRQIGSRQLPLERWVTMPLYQLSLDNRDNTVRQPVHVRVRRDVEEVDPEDTFAKRLEGEASKEQIEIIHAEDSSPSAKNVTGRMTLSFRTIGQDAFWLDTGVLNIP